MIASRLFKELLLLKDIKKQRVVYMAALKRSARWNRWGVLMGMGMSLCILVSIGLPIVFFRTMGSRWGLTESSVNIIVVFFCTFLSLTLMSGWCWLLYPMIARKKVRAALWYELNRHGCELCTTCGYDLRVNSSGKCSECGSSVIKPCLKEEDGRFRSVTLPPVSQCFSFMTALLILLWGNVIYLIVFRIKPTSYEGVSNACLIKLCSWGLGLGLIYVTIRLIQQFHQGREFGSVGFLRLFWYVSTAIVAIGTIAGVIIGILPI